MATVRPPAVSGLFYPASAAELRSAVEGFLRQAPARNGAPAPKAVIAPHAGYVYSGPIAGSAFPTLAGAASAQGPIKPGVLLGPSHFVPFPGFVLPRPR